MDVKKMGEAVSEALALQARIDSLKSEAETFQATISGCDQQLAKVKSLESTRAQAKTNLDTALKELSEAQEALEERLRAMKKDGIELPLGKKAEVRSGRL